MPNSYFHVGRKKLPAQIQECDACEIKFTKLYLSTFMFLFSLFNFISSKILPSLPLRLKLLHRSAQNEVLHREAKPFRPSLMKTSSAFVQELTL